MYMGAPVRQHVSVHGCTSEATYKLFYSGWQGKKALSKCFMYITVTCAS